MTTKMTYNTFIITILFILNAWPTDDGTVLEEILDAFTGDSDSSEELVGGIVLLLIVVGAVYLVARTKKTSSEIKAEEKIKAEKQFDLSTVEDFNKRQRTSGQNIVTMISPEYSEKILQDDIWKWELSEKDVDNLLKKASDEVYNDYIEKQMIKDIREEEDPESIVSSVEEALDNWWTEEEIIKIISVIVYLLETK